MHTKAWAYSTIYLPSRRWGVLILKGKLPRYKIERQCQNLFRGLQGFLLMGEGLVQGWESPRTRKLSTVLLALGMPESADGLQRLHLVSVRPDVTV